MLFFYQVGLRFYFFLIWIFSIWNPKAKKFIEGRKNTRNLLLALEELPSPIVWFHFASLGEFEQGRPLLDRWNSEFPQDYLAISFFSPSGFEVRKNYSKASLVCYLPMDNPKNANQFIRALNPRMAIFTKYEFWYFYFKELNQNKIPLIVVSGIFRKSQIYFQPKGLFFRKILEMVNLFFVQDENSQNLLSSIGIQNSFLSGDTRFDRVLDNSKSPIPVPIIGEFKGNNLLLIAGSTWRKDDEFLLKWMQNNSSQNWKCLIAPHEIEESYLLGLEKSFPNEIQRYSNWKKDSENNRVNQKRILILDKMGLLSSCYVWADLCYIGGGFGSGIHNILEAAIFGKPLILGPKYQKFKEANDLISMGAAISFSTQKELINLMKIMEDKNFRNKAGSLARDYCLKHTGATNLIFKTLKARLG